MRRAMLALVAVFSTATAASAADPGVFYLNSSGSLIGLPFASDDAVPSCDAAVAEVAWRAGVSSIDWVRDTGGGVYPSLIGRRYCEARSAGVDRHPSSIYYLIETNQHFAGIGAKVTFCVPENDRWRVYDANCRTVRPPR